MPRHPHLSDTMADIGGSVFSALAGRLATHDGPVFPLHVGDTWAEPAVGSRMQDLKVDELPGMHRYTAPRGLPSLLEALVNRLRTRTGVASIDPDSLLVSTGATGGLDAVMSAILKPGDEVVVLAPYWPLIKGIIVRSRGVVVEADTLGVATSADDVRQILESVRTEKTAALYVSTPNNPTGLVMPESWLGTCADWAREHELWIVSDDVYEDYCYAGDHCYMFGLAPERTFSAHSFSKAFGMAGNRCGYIVGPRDAMATLRKIGTHSYYSTPTASQQAAVRALSGLGDAWVEEMKPQYLELGQHAAERLGLDTPQGSQFLWMDVGDVLDERGLVPFRERCVDQGLLVAPGSSFGPYPSHIRICYTAAPPETVRTGVDSLATLLGR